MSEGPPGGGEPQGPHGAAPPQAPPGASAAGGPRAAGASEGAPFALGVNYWPRRKAMRWWRDFDAAEVEDELALIASLGLSLVRVFLLWEDWQPRPDAVSGACLAHLERVCDAAERHGLGLVVTFFTGHMSGPNWAPPWALVPREQGARGGGRPPRQVVSGGGPVSAGYRDPYDDPVMRAAQERLLTEVVTDLRGHAAPRLWSLGNEPDLFAWPARPGAGRAWVRDMAALVRRLDPARPVTCGLHVASLLEDNGLRADEVFAEADVAVMHAYPMYLSWARHPLDPDLVPFACALTSALCGKPVLAEEWGGCTAPPGEPSQTWRWTCCGEEREQFMAAEEDLAGYVAAVLPRLVASGATGALLWCFADYSEDLYGSPPLDQFRHERHFGLVRPDGSLKPHAAAVKEFTGGAPRARQVDWTWLLDVAADEYYRAPADNALRLYETYLQRLAAA